MLDGKENDELNMEGVRRYEVLHANEINRTADVDVVSS